MTFKFLIDECLSPALAEQAAGAGYVESTCVSHRGWSGLKDWELIRKVVAGNYTLVTHDARDFRGAGQQSPGGLHAKEEIHAGLVCLVSAKTMVRERQQELFGYALRYVEGRTDLVNLCVEIVEDEDGQIEATEYELPMPDPSPGPSR